MGKPKKKANTKVIRPGKELVESKADNFRKKLVKAMEEGIKEIVIDFAKVENMDAVGMATIVAAHNSLKKAGGVLKLKNVSKEDHNLFQITRLDQQFEVRS